jgi:hypothetical protein
LIENDSAISPEDYAELRELGERIQLVEKPGIQRLDGDLNRLRRVVENSGD